MSEFSGWAGGIVPESPAVYRQTPTPTGTIVAYAPGTTPATDVWEEELLPGATTVTYRLACKAGSVWTTLTTQ